MEKTLTKLLITLLVIASFIAFNNSYQTFGTKYNIMYWSWCVAGLTCLFNAVRIWLKQILSILLILMTSYAFAQPYGGIGLQNLGANVSIGKMCKKLDLNLQYKFPLQSATQARTLEATAGIFQPITKRDENNYSITLLAGVGWSKRRDYIEHSNSLTKPINEAIPVLGVELGKDAHHARFSLVVRYSDNLYYGAVMRLFLKR